MHVDELTKMAQLARETAAAGMRALEQAEQIETAIDRLAATAGVEVADVYAPLFEAAGPRSRKRG
jgi:predicted transcriptional regulator